VVFLEQYFSHLIIADRLNLLRLCVKGNTLDVPSQEVFHVYIVVEDLFVFSRELKMLNVVLKSCQSDFYFY
jgi:hypothetical protein